MNESAVLDCNCVTYDRVSQLMPDYMSYNCQNSNPDKKSTMFIQDYHKNQKNSLISLPVLTCTELAYCAVTAKRSTVPLYSCIASSV